MHNYFNFKPLGDKYILVTNDFGRYAFLSRQEFRYLLTDNESLSEDTYQKLRNDLFIVDPMDVFSYDPINDLRAMKNYLFVSTSLHIFVVTNVCNLSCIYCQAQSAGTHIHGTMSEETGRLAVDFALQSPAQNLTFEFQGGEPLFNFKTIKAIIEYAEEVKGSKTVDYTVVSNLTLLSDEILDFLLSHNVSISTSIDGPERIHNANRHTKANAGSYRAAISGIEKIRSRGASCGAIQTTTRFSLSHAKEIVHEYYDLGIDGIFLRPLTPLGFAKEEWEMIGYSAEEYLDFYKEALCEILLLNSQGRSFPEYHARYFLKKILRGVSDNYMELRSPCGASIGQLAYYYDGGIYTCDEARMLSESGDDEFRLGDVYHDSFSSIVNSGKCRATCAASVLEGIPGCCDCVYQHYCGVCPVINFAHNKDPFAKHAHDYRCKIYGGMLDHLFSLILENNDSIMKTLSSWVGGFENEECQEQAN